MIVLQCIKEIGGELVAPRAGRCTGVCRLAPYHLPAGAGAESSSADRIVQIPWALQSQSIMTRFTVDATIASLTTTVGLVAAVPLDRCWRER
jgi:hypothetical protein